MIQAIAELDREQAAGVLARTALSLEYDNAANVSAHEIELRVAVLDEARHKLGLSQDDISIEAIQRIGDLLDTEADQLIDEIDTSAALLRLAQTGELPSDLYEVTLVPNIEAVYGKGLGFETELIKATVQAPSLEQHYGPDRPEHEPALISLFVKYFRTKFYLKDFYMLVAGKRDGLLLTVHQAWRLYPSHVNMSGSSTPVQLLRKFADRYALDVTVNGKTGHFFHFEENVEPSEVTFPPGRAIYFSRFAQNDPKSGKEQAALIVSVDPQKYQKTLSDMRVDRKDMLAETLESQQTEN